MNTRMCRQYRSPQLLFSLKFHTFCRVGMSNVTPMHAFVACVAHPFRHHLLSEDNRASSEKRDEAVSSMVQVRKHYPPTFKALIVQEVLESEPCFLGLF